LLYSQQQGYNFELWLRESTNVTKPLNELIQNGDIIRKNLPF
jgi:hypothetical protein